MHKIPTATEKHKSRSGKAVSIISVVYLEVLVLELCSVDGLSTGSVVVGEVPALAHEVGDDAVERGGLVAVALLARAEGAEVLSSLGNDVLPELKYDGENVTLYTEERRRPQLFSDKRCRLTARASVQA